jgi:hypothetical protein
MLTIFTTAKPVEGHIGVIQRNALASWKLLHPDCEVILLGDEDGAAEAAADMELKHVPSIARNELGTPLLDDLFYKARQVARHEVLAFVNADIILMRDFMAAVEQVVSFRKRFLMIGQRRNAVVTEPLSFDPLWEKRLRKLVHRTAAFCAGIYYFVFPRDLWATVPPFAVGPNAVLTMQLSLPDAKYAAGNRRASFIQEAIDQIGATPGVQEVGAIDDLPFSGSRSQTVVTIYNTANRPSPDPAGRHTYSDAGLFSRNGHSPAEGPTIHRGRRLRPAPGRHHK